MESWNLCPEQDELYELLTGSESGSAVYDLKTSTPKRLSPTTLISTTTSIETMTSYSSPVITMHPASPAASRRGYHSTTSPVRHTGNSPLTHRTAVSPTRVRTADSPTRVYHSSPPRQNYMSELEAATIQKQRRELQLLIGELQDRDRELNDMVHAHHKQLLAWDEDRQRVVILEQKCSRYEAEVRGKNDQIKQLTGSLKVIETQEQSKACALESTQKQLEQLSEKASSSSLHLQDVEERNRCLNSTIRELSSQLGQLEAREQELITLLKLKDKDLIEASRHIMDTTSRIKRLDAAYKELKQLELDAKNEIANWKQRHTEAKAETQRIRGELNSSSSNNTEQAIQLSKAHEEVQSLKKELHIAGEREKRKDQLLELQRSRQERVDAELNNLRLLYERQQKEIALLQLNLDSKDELLALQETRISDTVDELNRSLSSNQSVSPVTSYPRTTSPSRPTKTPPPGRHHDITKSPGTSLSPSRRLFHASNTSIDNDPPAQDASSGSTDELLNITANDLTDNSPTSKLHRLLAESREMVKSLEQTALPPYHPTKPLNNTT